MNAVEALEWADAALEVASVERRMAWHCLTDEVSAYVPRAAIEASRRRYTSARASQGARADTLPFPELRSVPACRDGVPSARMLTESAGAPSDPVAPAVRLVR